MCFVVSKLLLLSMCVAPKKHLCGVLYTSYESVLCLCCLCVSCGVPACWWYVTGVLAVLQLWCVGRCVDCVTGVLCYCHVLMICCICVGGVSGV